MFLISFKKQHVCMPLQQLRTIMCWRTIDIFSVQSRKLASMGCKSSFLSSKILKIHKMSTDTPKRLAQVLLSNKFLKKRKVFQFFTHRELAFNSMRYACRINLELSKATALTKTLNFLTCLIDWFNRLLRHQLLESRAGLKHLRVCFKSAYFICV